jgi:hypothetical protein
MATFTWTHDFVLVRACVRECACVRVGAYVYNDDFVLTENAAAYIYAYTHTCILIHICIRTQMPALSASVREGTELADHFLDRLRTKMRGLKGEDDSFKGRASP